MLTVRPKQHAWMCSCDMKGMIGPASPSWLRWMSLINLVSAFLDRLRSWCMSVTPFFTYFL
jgi:hypothetical protein